MAAPGRKFSWTRLINNALPVMSWDSWNEAHDVDLSPKRADDLVRDQIFRSHPRHLSEKSFFIAGVVDAESLSRRVYRALVKHGLILPAPNDASSSSGPGPGAEATMTVNTRGVTRSFQRQLAIISVHAQRRLVGMLFFWEEECTRWKLLDDEEREILRALETGENRDLAVALEAVEMKKRLLPSQRAEGTANVAAGIGHELPSYG